SLLKELKYFTNEHRNGKFRYFSQFDPSFTNPILLFCRLVQFWILLPDEIAIRNRPTNPDHHVLRVHLQLVRGHPSRHLLALCATIHFGSASFPSNGAHIRTHVQRKHHHTDRAFRDHLLILYTTEQLPAYLRSAALHLQVHIELCRVSVYF